MGGVDFIEDGAGDAVDGDTAFLCQAQNLDQTAFFLYTLGDLQGKDLSAPGTQGLIDGLTRVEKFSHTLYFTCKSAWGLSAIGRCCALTSFVKCPQL